MSASPRSQPPSPSLSARSMGKRETSKPWTPMTQPEWPSSPAGAAASRRRLLVDSTPPPLLRVPSSTSTATCSSSPSSPHSTVSSSPRPHSASSPRPRWTSPVASPVYPKYHGAIPEHVRNAFNLYDANRSGFIDYLELRGALRGYGYDATIDECADLVRQYDDDDDGRLSLVRRPSPTQP